MTAQSQKMLRPPQPSEFDTFAAKIAEAKAAVASLGAQFIVMVADDLVLMENAFEEAQGTPTRRVDRVREIFGVAHNVKGQGSSFGYDLLTDVAGLLCQRTRDLTHVSDEALEAIGFHIRAMRVIVDGKISGKGGEKGKILIAKLAALPEPNLDPLS